MAGSIGSMSVQEASDEVTDRFCDPCLKEGTLHSVAGYCPKCMEFYCQSCLATHRRMAVSERHKILLGSDMPACQADKPVKYQLCDKHDGEGKDRYCFDHRITICGICYIREHKQCQVKEVPDACKSFNMSDEKSIFSTDLGMLIKHVKEAGQSIKLNKASLEKKQQDILTEAEKQRDKLLENVNQSYKDFSGKVTSLFRDHITILSARQLALDEIAAKVDTILQSLQESGPMKLNDQKEFLELLEFAEKVRLCEDKIKLLDLKHININCTLNSNIQPLIATKNTFGEISLQNVTFQPKTKLRSIHYPYTKPRQDSHKTKPESGTMGEHAVSSVKLLPLKKIKVKTPKDKEPCLVWGISVNVDGHMILADHANRKVKLFSPDGLLSSFLKLPERPKRVAFINKLEAAVSMAKKQIAIIVIADGGHLALKRTIISQQYVMGITAYKNNLILASDTYVKGHRSVQMIDIKGNKVMWTTTTDSKAEERFDCAGLLTTDSGDGGDTVIVTDEHRQTITLLDADTGKLVKVCHVKGKAPCDATVDGNGNVYVCYKSGEISVRSRDMQEQTLLTTEITHLQYPLAIAYNRRRSEIVVTSNAGHPDFCDFIHRFRISLV